ncbi:MAG: bifunctional riboflavin kinase/FAD synthetase [Gammaproteobacteria bacterium]|nr:bifunctional riboflavin kinase/FAD synthetase [Gammaproteobacteria bacterium]
MELVRGLHNLRASHRGGIATIGNFDGVHRGHQAVIAQVAELARRDDLVSTVITFEPTPSEFFAGAKAPPRLTRFAEKFGALRRTEIRQLLCLRFDGDMAAMEPEAFVESVLIEGLAVRRVVVGDDFRYGRKRAGDYDSLAGSARKFGFAVQRMNTFELDGERASSTMVRSALAAGNLQRARVLLGRPYEMCGRVIVGQQLGRELGYPTANIALRRCKAALRGIFAVRVRRSDNRTYAGVASLGRRPTVDGDHDLLEVHLFDFNEIIYGEKIAVEFLSKLRDEARFAGLDELVAQMRRDEQHARHALARYPL